LLVFLGIFKVKIKHIQVIGLTLITAY